MPELASCYVLRSDGTWARRGRGSSQTPPAPPTNLTGTGGNNQANLSWTPSPTPGVTYEVRRINVPVVVWSGTITNAVITGLTVYPTYYFQVFAILNGLSSEGSNIVSVDVSSTPSSQRFPGDPNPLANNGRMYWGCSMKGGIAPTTYESDTGVPVGIRHRYWSDSDGSSLAKMLTAVDEDHVANRYPLVSWRLSPTQWVNAANGTLDTKIDSFISGASKLTKPIGIIVNHEPDGGNGNGQPDGPAPDYQNWMRHFRSRITHWETVNGTSHPTLSFWGCWIGDTFNGAAGGPNAWYPGQGIFDVLGVDRYAWSSTDTSLTGSRWTAVKNFMKNNNQTYALTEWGIQPDNPHGGDIMQSYWEECSSGLLDIVAMSYFSPNGAWLISNTNGTLPKFETLMTNAKSIHMDDLGY